MMMPPPDLRDMRDGDLVLFEGSGFWSNAIKFRTLSRVTHVGIVVWVRGHLCVLEARERRGVRVFPLARYLGVPGLKVLWYELLADQYGIDRQKLISEALTHWGRRYASHWQFLRTWGLISRRIADLLELPDDTNAERFFCSEFVVGRLQTAGFDHRDFYPHPTDPATWSPGAVGFLPCLQLRGLIS